MATSLKAFQQEISSISDQKKAEHLRELRQAQQHASETGKGKPSLKVAAAGNGHVKGKPNQDGQDAVKGKVDPSGNGHPQEEDSKPAEIEVSIEDLLHEPTPANVDPADDPIRNHLGHLLVSHHGELIVSLGARPSATTLFGPDSQSSHPSTTKTTPAPPDEGGYVGKPVAKEQLESMLRRLKTATTSLQAQMTKLYLHEDGDPSAKMADGVSSETSKRGPYGSWIVRIVPSKAEEIVEVRVAVVGNVDSGKSTLTGVLTRGGLDDGRGKTRVALFRHKHELETGRTSSVGLEILGFSPTCEPVVPTGHAAANLDLSTTGSTVAKREKIAWDEVCSKAAKVVSFIDLAGHERYLKTTLFGLTGCSPDYVCLVIGGNAGLIGMSKEHLGVCLALQVPIIICVTKIDMTPAHVLEATIKQLVKVLKSPGCRKIPVFVESMEQAVNSASYLHTERICPIFMLSNVTGAGLPQLKTLLNCLPTSQGGQKYLADAPLEFSISDVFSVPFSGSVASGIIVSGRVKTGDNVLLGPDSLGQFIPTTVKSIQRKRVDVDTAEAGQSVSFALKKIRRTQLRKGMVILARQEPLPKSIRRFEAQMLVLYHNTTIQPRYQAMCHINSVRQTVRIVSIDHATGVLRTGDRAKVIFEFIQGPEYISAGAKVLVREARCRLLGVVTNVTGDFGHEEPKR